LERGLNYYSDLNILSLDERDDQGMLMDCNVQAPGRCWIDI